jgi:hypothetical protein
LLDDKGQQLMKQIIELGNQIKHNGEGGKFLYALVKNIKKRK